MMPKIYEAIERANADGMASEDIEGAMIAAGWPPEMVHQALDAWLKSHGRKVTVTGFKEWVDQYHHKARGAVAVVVVIGMVQAGVALLKPWPTKILADSAFGDIRAPGFLGNYTHTPTLILLTSLMTIGLFIIGSTFEFASSFILLKLGFWLNRSIKVESLRHILHLPLFHKERLAKGDYVYRQNVVTNSLSDLVLGTTSSIIGSILMIIGVLAIMVKFNPKLTVVSVVLMPLLYLTMRIFGPRMGKYSQKLTEVASETSASINEAVDNAETIQAFTLEDKQLAHVDGLWHKGYFLTKKSMLWSHALSNTNSFLVILATATVMYFGGTAALQGQMTFGQLLIFMTYMGYLLGPVESLVKQITSRNQKLIDVSRIYQVISDHQGVEDLRRDNHMPPSMNGVIDFENVTYSYNGQVVFQNLNLHINQGEKVGIIGPSGGGKSTILKLIPLFIEPQGGRILFDNIDTQTVSLHELRQHIAWVSQTPQLFSGSILDNLLDGDTTRQISNDELKNAVVVSNVAEFAIKLPLGINSPAGENGSSLSGGQRQRVAIARSLIKNAPILCLDEPTAALDTKSENYIRDSLLKIVQGKTVMMVTHRKALLSLMDTIYVLENGTLTNVNELGGLDYYLGVLEGIDQENIVKEIQQEQSQVSAEVIEQIIVQPPVVEEEIYTPPPPPPPEPPQSITNIHGGGGESDQEVVVKLH